MNLDLNMDLTLVLALAGVCMLTGLIASILYLVAGFREGVGWGIVNLLPFGSLLFTICRWQAAKAPFLLTIVSVLLASATVSLASKRLNDGEPITAKTFEQFAESMEKLAAPGGVPETDIESLRDREVLAEERVRARTAELTVAYAELSAKREALSRGDAEAVRNFNREAAAYAEQNRQLGEDRAELEALRRAIQEEVEKRSRAEKPVAVRPRVTVYSTSWCGPCKMAKAHLKKRGVAFQEIDVEKSQAGAEAFRKLGGGGVPLIVINGEQIRGFDAKRIDALLGQG